MGGGGIYIEIIFLFLGGSLIKLHEVDEKVELFLLWPFNSCSHTWFSILCCLFNRKNNQDGPPGSIGCKPHEQPNFTN